MGGIRRSADGLTRKQKPDAQDYPMKPVRMIEPFGAGGVVFAAQICVPRQTQTPAFIRLLRGFGAPSFGENTLGVLGRKIFCRRSFLIRSRLTPLRPRGSLSRRPSRDLATTGSVGLERDNPAVPTVCSPHENTPSSSPRRIGFRHTQILHNGMLVAQKPLRIVSAIHALAHQPRLRTPVKKCAQEGYNARNHTDHAAN